MQLDGINCGIPENDDHTEMPRGNIYVPNQYRNFRLNTDSQGYSHGDDKSTFGSVLNKFKPITNLHFKGGEQTSAIPDILSTDSFQTSSVKPSYKRFKRK